MVVSPAQWPAVVGKLVAVWSAAVVSADDAVYDGPPTEADVKLRWVTVGYQEDEDQGPGGQFQRAQIYDGSCWQETGQVLCEITAQASDPGIAAVRASAFQLLDVLTEAVESDLTLGGLLTTCELVVQPWPRADANQAEQRLRLSVNYTTETWI